MEATNALSGGVLNRFSPTQNGRFLYDLATGGDWRNSWMGNNGVVINDEWAKEHPYLTMAANGVADVGIGLLGNAAIPFARQTYNNIALDYSDRYAAMLEAQAYKNATRRQRFSTAFDRAAHNWNTEYGKLSTDKTGNMMYYDNGKRKALYYVVGDQGTPIAEPGGNMTITTHLGGDKKQNATSLFEVENMPRSARGWTYRFISGAPEGTYLGETGKTKNYVEQYFNTEPSKRRAFVDALIGRKVHNPAWDEEVESLKSISDDPTVSISDKKEVERMITDNLPHSMDSYEQMILLDKNGKFTLGYDSTPMGMFNPQGNHNAELLKQIKNLPLSEQVIAINNWIKSLGNPRARFAYIKNGKLQIPRTLLKTKKQ